MKILALDLSTSGTGWAHSNGQSGVQSFKPRRGDSPGMRWIDFKAWLNRLLDAAPADLLVYEQAHHRGGAATHVGHSLIACVEEVAAERKLEITPRHTSEIKKHALGGRKAKKGESKELMLKLARKYWPKTEFITNDQSDAKWLLDLVESELGIAELDKRAEKEF